MLGTFANYQAELFGEAQVVGEFLGRYLAALRFFCIKTLRNAWSIAETPYPKKIHRLPTVLWCIRGRPVSTNLKQQHQAAADEAAQQLRTEQERLKSFETQLDKLVKNVGDFNGQSVPR